MSNPKYTREQIIDFIDKNLETLSPHQVINYAIRLAIFLDTLGDELATAEHDFGKKRREILLVSKSAAEADREAEAKPEYLTMRKKRHLFESTMELINTLKKKADVYKKQMDHTT